MIVEKSETKSSKPGLDSALRTTPIKPLNDPLSFCVVIPMYNEEANAQKCVTAIYNHIKNLKMRTAIIAVNDGSKDRTSELLQAMKPQIPGLIVEEHAANQGYGGANVTGAQRGYREGFEYILFMDGDLTQRASYIDDFIVEMRKGTDFIKATRYAKGGGVDGVPFDRWLISYVGNKVAKFFFRLPLSDYTNGFRAIRAEFVPKIKSTERGFAYLIEEIAQVSKLGKTYGEVPYTLTVRQEKFSTSKFNYSFRTYFNYLKHLFKR